MKGRGRDKTQLEERGRYFVVFQWKSHRLNFKSSIYSIYVINFSLEYISFLEVALRKDIDGSKDIIASEPTYVNAYIQL